MHTLKWIKFLARWTICGLLLVAPRITAYADADVNGVSVKVFDRTPAVGTQKDLILRHFLGDQTIELPLAVWGHCEKPIDVRARLVQLSMSLGASFYEDNLEVISGHILAGDKPLQVHFSLPLPQVRDETDFELIYQVKIQGSRWFDAGRTKVRLYSKKILEPLKPLSEKVVLRLKDDGDVLRPLLEDLEVSITDYRSPVLKPEMPIVTLIVNTGGPVGSLGLHAMDLQLRDRESAVIFNEEVRTLPKVVKLPWQEGHLIQVELEILKNLRSDPRAQKTFMEIIQLAHPGE